MSFLVFDIWFNSGKMNVGFDGQYGHNSHDKFDASVTTKRMQLFDPKGLLAVVLGAYD